MLSKPVSLQGRENNSSIYTSEGKKSFPESLILKSPPSDLPWSLGRDPGGKEDQATLSLYSSAPSSVLPRNMCAGQRTPLRLKNTKGNLLTSARTKDNKWPDFSVMGEGQG